MSVSPPGKDALARLRHDLRTPVNHIIGYSELVAEDLASEGRTSLLADVEKIRDAAGTLLGLIEKHVTESGMAEAASAPVTFEPPEDSPIDLPPVSCEKPPASLTGHLLAVDDNDENREVIVRRLERQGHTTASAANGEDALTMLRRKPFDLVLLDVLMPELDGYEVLRAMKSDADLRHIPVIMISALDELGSVVRCIEGGAEDYLPKPFDPTLLRARIGASLEKKRLRDQEQEYLRMIERTQNRLANELSEAANYVRSIIPPPVTEPFVIDWRYVPSTELGGDAFGYHWIDDDHFAIYLLDVCGHGVGASLLSVTAINVIRSGSLAGTDFRDPGDVLTGLNEAFPMDRQNNMYFTIWYGVYHRPSRTLRHASGGHPPALLLVPGAEGTVSLSELRCPGTLIGVIPDLEYASDSCEIPPGSWLLVFCDGAYELRRPDRSLIAYEDFVNFMVSHGTRPDGLDDLTAWVADVQGGAPLDDDFSILRVQF